ncbi:MAG: HEAT repeat domain-containing protein [Gemmataceae bacterium]|nr:HEAT repeat domain-containing protein [Gemmataceae bacterium]
MSVLHPMLLGLATLLGADSADHPPAPSRDIARLREMLQNRHQSRGQSQAALLLVQKHRVEAEDIIRQGLRQTDSPEVFLALASALRLCRDGRFIDELLSAVATGRPSIRDAAVDTLALLADGAVLRRLQAMAEDPRTELPARQAALWALGRSGRQEAAAALIEQLGSKDEAIRQTASEALAALSGQGYGTDRNAWQSWWRTHRDLPSERWLEERLTYQTTRANRLEGDLDRAKSQLVQLHQQFYARLPVADRLGHVQSLAEHEDPAIRVLAVNWSAELLPLTDSVGCRALADLLLRLSHDGNLQVQRPSILALGRVSDPRALDRLKRLLRSGSSTARAAACHGLAQYAQQRVPRPFPETEPGPRNLEVVHQVVPLLQKALEDPALEVVVAAAEDLGSLGVPEAGPVLTALLRHPSEPVRLTAAQALERVADPKTLDALLAALEDPAVAVRFGVVGALGKVAVEGQPFGELQKAALIARLEELLLRDADAGVRSRAATVLGQSGPPSELSFLWRRVLSREDSRVQEKAWAAMLEILVRSANLDLLRHWDRTLAEANQGARRLQMLGEVCDRWKKMESTRGLTVPATEMLIPAQLDQGKWAASFPLVRELLARTSTDVERDRRLGWLLTIGERALADGNRTEALRAVREAQPLLSRGGTLSADFERLEKKSRP